MKSFRAERINVTWGLKIHTYIERQRRVNIYMEGAGD